VTRQPSSHAGERGPSTRPLAPRPATGPLGRDDGLAPQLGQAAVEVVALLPLVLVVALVVMQVLAAGLAWELAGHAAEAGAVAILQERDPRAAVHAALPGWSRRRAEVHVHQRRVRVTLQPPALIGRLAKLLAASAESSAGPVRAAATSRGATGAAGRPA
jgi:pilus assembly protein CpaE